MAATLEDNLPYAIYTVIQQHGLTFALLFLTYDFRGPPAVYLIPDIWEEGAYKKHCRTWPGNGI